MASGEKLLARLRASPNDCKRSDVTRMLEHYGFEAGERANHNFLFS